MRKNPQQLIEALPQGPQLIFVEPSNLCNFRCPFCPQALDAPEFGERVGGCKLLNPQVWLRLLESLKYKKWKVPAMRFYGIGEPLLNPRLAGMVLEAHEVACFTEVTTNGSRLTKKLVGDLIWAGLGELRLSVYGTNPMEYKEGTGGRFEELGRLFEIFDYLRRYDDEVPHTVAELVMPSPSFEAIERFKRQWRSRVHELRIKDMHGWGTDLVQFGTSTTIVKQACPFPFYECVVRVGGNVTVCTVDWDHQLTIGNVLETPFHEIWNGPAHRAHLQAQLSGDRFKIPSCAQCTMPNTGTPDNLDPLLGQTL